MKFLSSTIFLFYYSPQLCKAVPVGADGDLIVSESTDNEVTFTTVHCVNEYGIPDADISEFCYNSVANLNDDLPAQVPTADDLSDCCTQYGKLLSIGQIWTRSKPSEGYVVQAFDHHAESKNEIDETSTSNRVTPLALVWNRFVQGILPVKWSSLKNDDDDDDSDDEPYEANATTLSNQRMLWTNDSLSLLTTTTAAHLPKNFTNLDDLLAQKNATEPWFIASDIHFVKHKKPAEDESDSSDSDDSDLEFIQADFSGDGLDHGNIDSSANAKRDKDLESTVHNVYRDLSQTANTDKFPTTNVEEVVGLEEKDAQQMMNQIARGVMAKSAEEGRIVERMGAHIRLDEQHKKVEKAKIFIPN